MNYFIEEKGMHEMYKTRPHAINFDALSVLAEAEEEQVFAAAYIVKLLQEKGLWCGFNYVELQQFIGDFSMRKKLFRGIQVLFNSSLIALGFDGKYRVREFFIIWCEEKMNKEALAA